MAKVLWVGDAPRGNTGFGRITQNVLTQLIAKGWECANLGINSLGDPHDDKWPVYCAITGGDPFGFNRIAEVVRLTEPDIIVISQDVHNGVAREYRKRLLAQLGPVAQEIPAVVYFPVDGGGWDSMMIDWMHDPMNTIWPVTYTEYGARIARQAGLLTQCHVIPLGIDTSVYYPMDRMEARRIVGMGPEHDDTFLILNANRNDARKGIDLTVRAYFRFLAANPDANALLWLHMERQRQGGWGLARLCAKECKAAGLDPKKYERSVVLEPERFSNYTAPDENYMRALYNASDVGLTTSLGEGWGFTPMEGAACDRPQIVPHHTSLEELWGDILTSYISSTITDPDTMVERYIANVEDVAEDIRSRYGLHVRGENHGYPWHRRAMEAQFQWPAIGEQWDSLLRAAIACHPWKERQTARLAAAKPKVDLADFIPQAVAEAAANKPAECPVARAVKEMFDPNETIYPPDYFTSIAAASSLIEAGANATTVTDFDNEVASWGPDYQKAVSGIDTGDGKDVTIETTFDGGRIVSQEEVRMPVVLMFGQVNQIIAERQWEVPDGD